MFGIVSTLAFIASTALLHSEIHRHDIFLSNKMSKSSLHFRRVKKKHLGVSPLFSWGFPPGKTAFSKEHMMSFSRNLGDNPRTEFTNTSSCRRTCDWQGFPATSRRCPGNICPGDGYLVTRGDGYLVTRKVQETNRNHHP